MKTYSVRCDCNIKKELEYLHTTYFHDKKPLYGMLYSQIAAEQMLYIKANLEDDEVTYLSLRLNVKIVPYETDCVIDDFLESYDVFSRYFK